MAALLETRMETTDNAGRAMIGHHDPHHVIAQLIHWADRRDPVRAVLLTSTRAQPEAATDIWSDYDVVLVVKDIRPFYENRSWLADFGDILVEYWDPILLDSDHGIERTANVIQYADGLKIDFNLWPVELLNQIVRAPELPAALDAGYQILLDKERLTASLAQPTYRAFIPARPTEDEYRVTVSDFFSDAPYVAKCLWRGELLPAKWCLDFDMKNIFLLRILEWRMERDYGWAMPAGNLGKGLKKHLPLHIWNELERTYVGANTADNWDALFLTMMLFRSVAIQVAADLGYTYPEAQDRRVTAYVRAMRDMERETAA
jgi:aminoglycoside 6-adenylyltransferase